MLTDLNKGAEVSGWGDLLTTTRAVLWNLGNSISSRCGGESVDKVSKSILFRWRQDGLTLLGLPRDKKKRTPLCAHRDTPRLTSPALRMHQSTTSVTVPFPPGIRIFLRIWQFPGVGTKVIHSKQRLKKPPAQAKKTRHVSINISFNFVETFRAKCYLNM